MKCLVCNFDEVKSVGIFRPYLDYECEVYDCTHCKCRFVDRDASVYEKLHSSSDSSYASHERMASKVSDHFRAGEIEALKTELCKTPKNAFVIDSIDKRIGFSKLLEIGCSKGYLTSYFIAKKHDVLAVDISPSAVQTATRLFGKHFCAPDSPRIREAAPYDAIYHVGTIGCVESPIELTRYLLSLLRPGGILLFNAPNVNACREIGAIWVRGTPPPDLVTLFPPEFWQAQFDGLADVQVVCEPADTYTATMTYCRNLFGLSRVPEASADVCSLPSAATHSRSNWIRFIGRAGKAAVRRVVGGLGRPFFEAKYSSEFGMYVTMVKGGTRAGNGDSTKVLDG